MLIEDHSITYINLQDKSGMKFDSSNKVTEIINYWNKLFEYKYDEYNLKYDITYIVDNINLNESHLNINNGYLESNIIEEYRITLFVVIKERFNDIFKLYDNSDHSISLLKANFIFYFPNIHRLFLEITTTDIKTLKTLNNVIYHNNKNLICISLNGINSAVYLNGKKNIFLLILELVLQQVES